MLEDGEPECLWEGGGLGAGESARVGDDVVDQERGDEKEYDEHHRKTPTRVHAAIVVLSDQWAVQLASVWQEQFRIERIELGAESMN